MRVVGGTAKGHPLLAVPGTGTRPILDRVRTALFDILRPRLSELIILDLFAGTGSVGIEALSQGAKHCTFVELDRRAYEIIQKNLEHTCLAAKASVILGDAFAFIRQTIDQYDLIYSAPPQYQTLWLDALHAIAERVDIITPGGSLIVQIDPREYQPVELGAFREVRQKKYGNTLLTFYQRLPETEVNY